MQQELSSVIDELVTLEKIAAAAGVVPANITTAIAKVLDVLSKLDLVKPDSAANVLTDVKALIAAIDDLDADANVKEFAAQVVTLIENAIKAISKPAVSAPASVVIQPIPLVNAPN